MCSRWANLFVGVAPWIILFLAVQPAKEIMALPDIVHIGIYNFFFHEIIHIYLLFFETNCNFLNFSRH